MPTTGSLHGPSGRRPLSPENVAGDFDARSEPARHGVGVLYDVLLRDSPPAAVDALDRWKRLVSGACGHDVLGRSPAADKLAACYGLPVAGLQPAEALFALSTYYALVVKLLVWQILSSRDERGGLADRVHRAESGRRLEREVRRLEAGSVFRAFGVVDPFQDGPFSWYTTAWNEPIAGMVRGLADRVGRYDPATLSRDPALGGDLLKRLYENLFPRRLRHALGEYYTPDWLARHVLDEVGYRGDPEARLLDPACGSGTFLVTAIRRIRAWHEANGGRGEVEPGELCTKILRGVTGFDLNPLAVLSARANYLIAICDLLAGAGRVEVPVLLCDSILSESSEADALDGGRFDYVVGNPPWIAWDDLPSDYRRRTKPLWQRYGLFSLSASEARHGGAKKDLSMLMLYAAADRYLKPKARLGMVVTQTLFQTKGAGDGFRRFRLGSDGDWLRVVRVNDLADFRPFPGVANWTATIVLEKGNRTTYPVPYVKWSIGESLSNADRDGDAPLCQRRCLAEPIDPNHPTSPWFVRPVGLKTDRARLVGPSDYEAHLGANSGGANGVYWVTVLGEQDGGLLVRNLAAKGKRRVASVEQVIERDLLYPLLRWGDVARYRAQPSAHLLLAQDVHARRGIDEGVMRGQYPKTYAYLERFTPLLSRRAAYKRYQERAAFYSMYNVGPYTVAPVKVVWRRMDRRVNAAVVEALEDPVLGVRAVVPQETCVLVAAESLDEAHYLCAVMNSAVVGFLVTSHSVRGGKGFGSPGMLDFIRLRQFEPDDALHRELAAASRQAHEATRRGEDVVEIQHQIDRSAGRLWGLDPSELEAIRREVEGPC
jgi:hypothetical protein